MPVKHIKGTAMSKEAFLWMQKHHYRWRWRQFIKRIFTRLGITIKFNYK
jgi:hypothetical protein